MIYFRKIWEEISKMKKLGGLILVSALILLAGSALAQEINFRDVPQDHWAKTAVYDLVKRGVTQGYPDGTYRGDKSITRYETAMFLSKLAAMLDSSSQIDVSSLKADIKSLREEIDELKKSPSPEPKGIPVTGSFRARYRVSNSVASGTASGANPARGPRIDYRLKTTLAKDLGGGAGVKINMDTMDSGFNGGDSDLAKKLLDIEGNLAMEWGEIPVNVKVTAGPGPVMYSPTFDAILPSEVGTVYMRPRNSLSLQSFIGAFDIKTGYTARTITPTGEVGVSQLTASIGYTFVGLPMFETFKIYLTGDQLANDMLNVGLPTDTRGLLMMSGSFNERTSTTLKLGASKSEVPNEGYYIGAEISLQDPWETGTFATLRYNKTGPDYLVSSLEAAEFDMVGLDYFDKPIQNNIQDWGLDFTQFLTKQLALKLKGDLRTTVAGEYGADFPECSTTLDTGLSYNIAPGAVLDLTYKIYQVPSDTEDQTKDSTSLSFLYKF